MCLCFRCTVFVCWIDPKLVFLRLYHGKPERETQSNSALQQYSTKQYNQAVDHITSKRQEQYFSIILLLFLSSNPLLMLAFFFLLPPPPPSPSSQGIPLLLNRMKGLHSSADAQFHSRGRWLI